MSGIFICHSSSDKSFVLRLAIDLVNRDYPVWVDTWALEIADHLRSKITDAIDQSSFLIIVVSESSLNSGWVTDELNAALAKERQMGRPFVIPVKIDQSQLPSELDGRIYADFSGRYFDGLQNLTLKLSSIGAGRQAIPVERHLIPIELINGIHVNEPALRKRLRSLASLPDIHNSTFNQRQIVFSPDDRYTQLRGRFYSLLERIRSSPSVESEELNYLFEVQQGVETLERAQSVGAADLLNRTFAITYDAYHVATCCAWFVRMVRNELHYLLWSAQKVSDCPAIDLSPHCIRDPFGDEKAAASFFGVTDTEWLKVFRESNGETCDVWLDAANRIARDLVEFPQDRYKLEEVGRTDLAKFIIPRLMYRTLIGGRLSPDWTISDCRIRWP
jgi:hypothetical protein